MIHPKIIYLHIVLYDQVSFSNLVFLLVPNLAHSRSFGEDKFSYFLELHFMKVNGRRSTTSWLHPTHAASLLFNHSRIIAAQYLFIPRGNRWSAYYEKIKSISNCLELK